MTPMITYTARVKHAETPEGARRGSTSLALVVVAKNPQEAARAAVRRVWWDGEIVGEAQGVYRVRWFGHGESGTGYASVSVREGIEAVAAPAQLDRLWWSELPRHLQPRAAELDDYQEAQRHLVADHGWSWAPTFGAWMEHHAERLALVIKAFGAGCAS